MKLEILSLARIEGHARLVVDAASGELKECRLKIFESPRFFQGLLKWRHYHDCWPMEEILQSHFLQLYFMAVPDFLGVGSIFPLAKSRRELVMGALRLKKLANDICHAVGGRPVHPVIPCVGDFSALPQAHDLLELRRRLVTAFPDLEATVKLFASFEFPEFAWETLWQWGRLPAASPVSAWMICFPPARSPACPSTLRGRQPDFRRQCRACRRRHPAGQRPGRDFQRHAPDRLADRP